MDDPLTLELPLVLVDGVVDTVTLVFPLPGCGDEESFLRGCCCCCCFGRALAAACAQPVNLGFWGRAVGGLFEFEFEVDKVVFKAGVALPFTLVVEVVVIFISDQTRNRMYGKMKSK